MSLSLIAYATMNTGAYMNSVTNTSDSTKWIDVNEKLPPKDVYVLVYVKETDPLFSQRKGHICMDKIHSVFNEFVINQKCMGQITHWMPLPPTDSIEKK